MKDYTNYLHDIFEKLEGNVNHYKFIKQGKVIYKSKDYSSLGTQKTQKIVIHWFLRIKLVHPIHLGCDFLEYNSKKLC